MTKLTASSNDLQGLPIAVLGAGPVGLAAAAHVIDRGGKPLIFEAADQVAGAMRQWAHVRIFSPWRFVTDKAAVKLLETRGWQHPNRQDLPTGGDIVEHYLEPLAELPEIHDALKLGRRVVGVARHGISKMRTEGREQTPFVIHTVDKAGTTETWLARAVIDATGTWNAPNPAGADGLLAAGETRKSKKIFYGIPHAASNAGRYAGRRVAVIGGGHSAIQSISELLAVQELSPATTLHWLMRTPRIVAQDDDILPARGALAQQAQQWIDQGRVTMHAPYSVRSITPADEPGRGLVISGAQGAQPQASITVDQIVVNTGLRPNLEMLQELRLALDPALEAPPALAPLIDPRVHHCGSVPPHGEAELRQPEPGFYIVGMKSYGRAPTFLMATGYEQVRSIVAHLEGDEAAARRVELQLPASGACGQKLAQQSACC